MRNALRRSLMGLLIVALLSSGTGFAMASQVEALGSGDVKWTETETPDGWTKVTNEGGDTLGYSKESGIELIQVDGYAFKDMNRNGLLDVYEDWRLDSATRAEDLANQMRGMDEAKMVMFLSLSSISTPSELGEAVTVDLANGIRSFSARAATVAEQVQAVNMLQRAAEALPFGIPVDLRGDIGNSLASRWPNHLGFAATFDPELVAEFSRLYSSELRDLGLTSVHHPQMDIATEPRWRRFTGTFGEDPALTRDMGTATVNALQSTYAEDGTDLGWGDDSVNAQVKHFPGDGAGEGGRESHANLGKFNVFPGGAFTTHLIAYEEALTQLPGKTGVSAGVMTNFSISIDGDGTPIGGEAVGTAYSYYKTHELLRERFGWNGLIDTDYSIINMMPWGMESESTADRLVKALEAGSDRIANFNDKEAILEGFELYAETYGEEAMDERIHESIVRLFITFDNVGLFDNPYLSTSESTANVANADKMEKGLAAQIKSVIMLKNSGNLIQEAGTEKATIYIPMRYNTTSSSWSLPIDIDVASEYFNVVTDAVSDTLTGPADDKGNPTATEEDIIRASAEEIAACDFALAIIDSPSNVNLTTERFGQAGYNSETGEYLPLSLQYRPYTADSEFVRQVSIAGDMVEGETADYYGQAAVKTQENRSYYGNTAVISNESHLDMVLYAADACDKVVVVANASNPFVVAEFEPEVDALLLHFGVTDKAICEIVSGKVEPSGLLPMQMPLNMDTVEAQYEDVPFDMDCYVDADGNTYGFTFGLSWSGMIQDERVEKYNVPTLVGE